MNLQEAFEWYSDLAKRAGWRDYVIDRAREMATEFPETFEKLPAMLLRAQPSLALCHMERSNETRANTYRLRADRFLAPSVVARKRKGQQPRPSRGL